MSKKYDIESACIMGETSMLEIDANAAKAVLEVVKKIINIDINMENLEKIKTETEKIISDIENISKSTQEGQPGGRPSNDMFTYIR